MLGQYEFTLADPDAPARLLFVAPNIVQAAVRLDADLEELQTWIAFHEVTHAVQFTAVGWLRPYLAGLLRELLGSLEVKVDPRALLRLPSLDDVRGLADAFKEGGLVAAIGGPRQRELLDRMQAVMGVVEGHAEHVMDVVGADALPSLAELRAALDRRRNERPPLLALLERLIGLEAKMRQYAEGKRFCDAVAKAAGPAGLHTRLRRSRSGCRRSTSCATRTRGWRARGCTRWRRRRVRTRNAWDLPARISGPGRCSRHLAEGPCPAPVRWRA